VRKGADRNNDAAARRARPQQRRDRKNSAAAKRPGPQERRL